MIGMIRNFSEFVSLAKEEGPSVQAFREKHFLRDWAAADHICYKCPLGQYDFFRTLLEDKNVGLYSFQEWISGRRITYIKLCAPIALGTFGVHFVELSEAKSAERDEFGFHHMEIYPAPPAKDYNELCDMLRNGGETLVFKERPHHPTHDITLEKGFIIRLTREPLIRKIIREIL